MNATTNVSDGFVRIARKPRNADRWIVRSSILDSVRRAAFAMSGRVLDVGCGIMPYRSLVRENPRVTDYVGLDIESAIVYDAAVRPDVTWDGETMPFSNDEFDCAMATEVFEHVPEPARLLAEIRRVLRPGGRLFFTTPCFWPYHEAPHDHRRFTEFGLRSELQRAGFGEIEIVSVGNWHSSLAQLLGLWVNRAPMPRAARFALRPPVYLAQRLLMRWDRSSSATNDQMPRMLAGSARKDQKE